MAQWHFPGSCVLNMLQGLTPPGCLGNCLFLSQNSQEENTDLDAASLFSWWGGLPFCTLPLKRH